MKRKIDMEDLYDKGYEAQLNGDLDEARMCYAEVVRRKPDWEAGHYGLAMLHRNQGDHEQALVLFRKIAEEMSHPLWAGRSWIMIGLLLWEAGKPEEALTAYKKALDGSSRSPETPEDADIRVRALTGIGHWEYQAGNLLAATEAFSEAISLQPEDPNVQANLALCYSDLGMAEKAIPTLLQLLARYPERSDWWYDLAEIYKEHGDVELAIIANTKALQVGNTRAEEALDELPAPSEETWYEYGRRFEKSGLPQHAIGCYRRALTLGYESAREALSRLEPSDCPR